LCAFLYMTTQTPNANISSNLWPPNQRARSTEVHFFSRAEDTAGELTRNRESASPRFCTKVSEL